MRAIHIRIAAVFALSFAGFGGDAREELGCSPPGESRPLDEDAAEANVVVSLGGCSGLLVTPQIVATAAHCIYGSAGNGDCSAGGEPRYRTVSIGVNGIGPPEFSSIAIESRIGECVQQGHSRAHDFALLYLEEPVTTSSIATRASVDAPAVPRVARPKLDPPPCDGIDCDTGCGRWPWVVGAAGYGVNTSSGGTGRRRAVLFIDGSFESVDSEGDRVWEKDVDRWIMVKGDSGGPLFVVGPHGEREIIGVYSGTIIRPYSPFVEVMRWADITRGANRDWLLDRVREKTIREELRHSARWLGAHGKTEESWWGELDYSGPCDRDRDHDCDGWWDEGPVVHDNCPPSRCGDRPERCANPDQADRDDDGVGDACSVTLTGTAAAG